MATPVDDVAPGPIPTEPGFYWRRQLHHGDTAKAGWRWAPAEVYRMRDAGPGGVLMTNGHGIDGVTWGPRIFEPGSGTDREYWRNRAEVTARDVERAGITLAQCEAWLTDDGWTLGSDPQSEHRVWEKDGRDRVNLSPNTPSWTYCLATGIAVTIDIRAQERGRPAHDILDEMAAIPT